MDATVLGALRSDDDDQIREGIRKCLEPLRAMEIHEPELSTLSEQLVALAAHGNWKVRQLVAESAQHLPETWAERMLAPLLKDRSHYVRDEANRTLGCRSARRRANAMQNARDEQLHALFSQLDRAYGSGARRLAERIAAVSREAFVGSLYHEVVKVLTSLELSVNRLHAEVNQPALDVAVLTKYAGIAQERLEVFTALFMSARAFTMSVVPVFRIENILELVEAQCAKLVERLEPATAAKVTVTKDISAELTAEVDRGRLEQALQNVLQNAVEAYLANCDAFPVHVTAGTVRGGTQVAISIRDQGTGMTEEVCQQALVPFGSTKNRGSGFGLPIAQKMVEVVHGGSLVVTSKRGRGTTVTLTFPLRQSKGGRS